MRQQNKKWRETFFRRSRSPAVANSESPVKRVYTDENGLESSSDTNRPPRHKMTTPTIRRKRVIPDFAVMNFKTLQEYDAYTLAQEVQKMDTLYNNMTDTTTMKSKRKTTNLGFNTASAQEECYAAIEKVSATHRCGRKTHEGKRDLPVREFYLMGGGKKLQGACIMCDKKYRADRSKRSRDKFKDKTKKEIHDMYRIEYGHTMECSKCKEAKPPTEFSISIGMECGLHNHCIACSIGNSQGNGGLRDFIFMPDKDGIKYTKKKTCERCNGTHKLAVDHILPIAKGGTDCIPNKQTLCIHCNSKKNDTIDCHVKSEFLSARYKDKDSTLDFSDNTALTRILSKKVYEFKQSTIVNASLEEIRTHRKEYAKKYNLGHNLDRIVENIAILFNKTC